MGSWRKWSLFALLIAAAVIVDVSGQDTTPAPPAPETKKFQCYEHKSKAETVPPKLDETKKDCETCCIIASEKEKELTRSCAANASVCEGNKNEKMGTFGFNKCEEDFCNGPNVFQCYKHTPQDNPYTPQKTEKEPCNTCCTLTKDETDQKKYSRGCADSDANCKEKKEVDGVDGDTNCKDNYCNGPKFFKCYKHEFQLMKEPKTNIEKDCNTCCTIEKNDEGKLKRDCADNAKASCGDDKKNKVEGYNNACTKDHCNGPKVFQCYVHGPQDNAVVPTEINYECNTCCVVTEDKEGKVSRGCEKDGQICLHSQNLKVKDFGKTRCAEDLCNGPDVFQCFVHGSQNKTKAPTETQNCTTCCTIKTIKNTENLERACAKDRNMCDYQGEVGNFGTTGCDKDFCNGPQSVTAETTTAATPGTNQTGKANETVTNTTTTGTTVTTTVAVATTTAKAEATSTKKPTTKPPPTKQAGGDGLRPLVTALLFPTLAFFLR